MTYAHRNAVTDLLPGLGLLLVVALCAHVVEVVLPETNRLLVAIFIGVIVANSIRVPTEFAPGLATHKLLLETGIVLIGVQLSLAAILQTGPLLITLIVGTILFGIALIEGAGRVLNGGANKLTSLIAAGASICGVSAVIAVAGSIDADEEQIAYAVGAVLLLDAVTLILYPVAGELLALPGKQFGIWAGLSMFSTGPVTAVGFAYSDVAGRWATLTKIIRNTLIGLVAVGYSVYWMRSTIGGPSGQFGALWDNLPKFLVGFFLVVVIANVVSLAESTVSTIETVRTWCFLLAFAGLGFDIKLTRLREVGVRPLVTIGVYFLAVSAVTLSIVVALF